ncbi:MAG: B12-binding domain-containing radical SAM protein [Candidatus Omnitrophica bacterium]|jgi:anaerobic magnesium-protoporphyrin IX monomethyl ester cyclase|nr:B12-binding domain-containing radical SAM protein [Candidatus Omnitrophota bacterium]
MSYKLAIINPKTKGIFHTAEPLNILALATYVQKTGINVKIIDEFAGDNILNELKSFQPDLVGFTSVSCIYPKTLQLLKEVKSLGYRTIIGGSHASTLSEKTLEDGFDMVVVGEGEKILLEIISKGYKKGLFKAAKEDILKSEELIVPNRKLINMEFYCNYHNRSVHREGVRTATMHASRGCPFNCIFCHNTWRDTPVRFLSPEAMIQEVEQLIVNYNIKFIVFNDDNFFIDRKRAIRFCELILKKNFSITWATPTRPDSVDEEVLAIASQAGCKTLAFGFESGSQRILDVLNKKLSVQKNLDVIKLCRKYHIRTVGLFMVGNPTETKEDIRLTWNFIKKAKLDMIRIGPLTALPGTQLWDWCKKEGYIPEKIDFSNLYPNHASIQIPSTFLPRQIEIIKTKLIIKSYLLNGVWFKKVILSILRHPIHMVRLIFDEINFTKKVLS